MRVLPPLIMPKDQAHCLRDQNPTDTAAPNCHPHKKATSHPPTLTTTHMPELFEVGNCSKRLSQSLCPCILLVVFLSLEEREGLTRLPNCLVHGAHRCLSVSCVLEQPATSNRQGKYKGF